MIQIEIPDYDITLDRDNVALIPKGTAGIYVFYGADNDTLYIGKAGDLYTRIRSHFIGKSNLRDVYVNLASVSCIYESDPIARDIYETWMINTLKSPLNVDKVWTYRTDRFNPARKTDAFLKHQDDLQKQFDNIYLTVNL